MIDQGIIKRRAFLWNTASGILNAGQSAIVLIFVAHCLNKTDAGIFTIAYALANLVMIVGKYGLRNYQVTDIEDQFSFNQYFTSRLITSLFALLLTGDI